jgi:cytochrome c-type biogenesis protein
MIHDVSIVAAFFAGLVSFLSPCVLPLVPPYLVYLAGATIEHVATGEAPAASRRAVMSSALLFVCGFGTVFVALGAVASTLGQAVQEFQLWLIDRMAALGAATGLPIPSVPPLTLLAGIIIIVMGLHFLGLTRIGLLMREGRLGMAKPVGLWGAYVMGLAFAFGWTPCIGPILTTILAVAASESSVGQGMVLLAIYSAGLGIPFLLAAWGVESFAAMFARFKHQLRNVERAMGALLVLAGVAFITNATTYMANWLIDAFPVLSRIG